MCRAEQCCRLLLDVLYAHAHVSRPAISTTDTASIWLHAVPCNADSRYNPGRRVLNRIGHISLKRLFATIWRCLYIQNSTKSDLCRATRRSAAKQSSISPITACVERRAANSVHDDHLRCSEAQSPQLRSVRIQMRSASGTRVNGRRQSMLCAAATRWMLVACRQSCLPLDTRRDHPSVLLKDSDLHARHRVDGGLSSASSNMRLYSCLSK